MALFLDLIGTLRSSLKVAKATFDAAGLTAPRSFTLPDAAGTVALAGKPRVASVAYGASVTLDCSTADVFKITLTGPITVDFSNAVDGQKIEVRLTQDGTGSRAVNWAASVAYGSDLTSALVVASTTASKQDKFGFEYDATATKYQMISCARGY
jgi:hypothetical protein